ncbi:AAA family ATPase [Kocuria sp. SM24M-10]|uniref:AAA family ATPase n=1 Tax=Kocuria sp. SM24M-10 TaxID=1660349 RepID=UPI00069B0E06|nr:AAA family ATPase [Kocuria sp. SM24M-10]
MYNQDTAPVPPVGAGISAAVDELALAGLAALPVQPGTKRPAVQWKNLQGRRPTEEQLAAWFAPERLAAGVGVGAIMGTVSGGVELTEIEGRAAGQLPAIAEAMRAAGLALLWKRLQAGWLEISPSRGVHWLYRLEVPVGEPLPGNTKIARRPAGEDDKGRPIVEVLAETRGEGGFVVLAPTDGSHHSTGRAWRRLSGGPIFPAVLTVEEREAFHAVLHEVLDEMPEPPARSAPRTDTAGRTDAYGDGESPVEHYNRVTDWETILVPNGWTHAYTKGNGERHWFRPGKDRGQISATTDRPNDDGASRLYVFSTSTDLEAEVPLTKAYVAAHYAGESMSALAGRLRREGYGDPLEGRPSVFTDEELGALAGLTREHSTPATLHSLTTLSTLDHEEAQEAASAPESVQDDEEDLLDLDGIPSAQEGTDEGAEEEPPATWDELDLSAVLDGTWTSPEATLMEREDGACLLYRGMVHAFIGESESGKSLLLQAEAARVLAAGGTVLYLDFESDQGTVVSRMLALGAPAEALRARRLSYRRPEVTPIVNGKETAAWRALLARPFDLAVIDGVTEAFAVFGVSSVDNDEVTAWGRNVPRKIAARTGAAVAVVDHVTKATEGRGRFAIGAQAKMSYLTGASYTVEVKSPLGVDMVGVLSLRVGKDRPGRVRPVSGAYRASDRSQEAARAVIDSTEPGKTSYVLQAPEGHLGGAVNSGNHSNGWRPTGYMERVSRALELAPGYELSKTKIRSLVSGGSKHVDAAILHLEQDGHISRHSSNQPYRLLKPYRENGAELVVPGTLTLTPDSPKGGESGSQAGSVRESGMSQTPDSCGSQGESGESGP